MTPQHVLPDYLKPRLRVVFCGTAPSTHSAKRKHYYAGPGNEFWQYLHESGLTPVRLTPDDDARVLEFGLGLTDLAKHVASATDAGIAKYFDAKRFVDRMEEVRPRWIAFNGKTAGGFVARKLGCRQDLLLGVQPWKVGKIPVFVAPSSSASNRDPKRLEGKLARVDWYLELSRLARKTPDR